MPIVLKVPGVPVAQPRQRHRIIAGHVSNYTPSDSPVNAYKAAIRLAWLSKENRKHIPSAPKSLTVVMLFPRPKSRTKKRGPNPSYWHTSKPDLDNVVKAIKDALTGLAWNDDSQVCMIQCSKRVCAAGEEPSTEITIRDLSEEI